MYVCASCGKISYDVFDFSGTGSITSLCQECRRTPPSQMLITQTQGNLSSKEHLQNERELPMIVCQVESKGNFPSTVEFTQNEPKAKRIPCNICGKTFKVKSQLLMHLPVHTGEKNYECHICKNRFAHKTTLTQHVAIHLASTGPKFSCERCPKTFSCKKYLSRHQRLHCNIDKSLSRPRKRKLSEEDETFNKYAVSLPSGEKGYLCLVCGKKYTYIYTMRDHIQFHTRENVHKCEYCGKEFQNKNNLMTHTTIHTGDKKYPCSVCEKRFSQRSHLRAHMKYHTGEKSFACEECGRSFGIKGELRRHMLKHTGDDRDRYLCEICGKQYVDKYCFVNHQEDHKKQSKCTIKKKGSENNLVNGLSEYGNNEILSEGRLLTEHHHNYREQETFQPSSLEKVKEGSLCDELISEDRKEITCNELTENTIYIKNEFQYSDDENSLLDTSLKVKMEVEDELV
ncbi:zinc finger protein 502-like isoform X1 [Palaemon carinicauda]|uniref:zinc finger protein 502-like isoform X1 n=1 Tax=Palaemon carinicauda TaxID=392227 RepID=UPI0035B604CA